MELLTEYREAVMKMPSLFRQLRDCPSTPLSPRTGIPKAPGVYALFENDEAVYVGRSKNLRQRIGNHTSGRPEQSSFAFKLAREETGRVATYKVKGSRKQLMADPAFSISFQACVSRIRGFKARFVVIENDILQHLFEVYAALALNTHYNDFKTS